ncbi:MAG: hypothetical protein CVV42_15570 [Candidatus Riflebacteria bacterium HGW-Riflebacteria-2]|nr:MAG: hypothetical protein CVV42_15570 [Candidatus Riflebacteria bacterium HGW-Riflebacteria-2]
MEILLNDNRLDIEGINPEVTVLELLTTVEESLKGTQATVIEIILDEKSYSADDMSEISTLKVMAYQKIELFTATAQDMVRAAFADGEAGLQHLEELAVEVASELRIGKVKEGMDRYLEFVDGIEWLVTMLKNADLAFASNMAESSLESDRQSLVQRLGEQMNQVQIVQEAQDWVGLADILEYEFPEILQDSRGLIKSILVA